MSDTSDNSSLPPEASQPPAVPSQPAFVMPVIMTEWDQRSANPVADLSVEAERFNES